MGLLRPPLLFGGTLPHQLVGGEKDKTKIGVYMVFVFSFFIIIIKLEIWFMHNIVGLCCI